jgi:hypothetical protein
MKRSAEQARADAQANTLKATLLKPDETNSVLAEALKADPVSAIPVSAADRLAALAPPK